MGSGLLTGPFTAERVAGLPDDDWRRSSPDFTTNLDRNLAVGERLAHVAERHGVSRAAAAVAWTLGFRGVSGAIVGARSPEQIDGWVDAARIRLTPEDYELVGVRTSYRRKKWLTRRTTSSPTAPRSRRSTSTRAPTTCRRHAPDRVHRRGARRARGG